MLIDVCLNEVSIQIPAQRKEMLSLGKTQDGRTKVRINSSSLFTIQECMRKSKLLLAEEWRSDSESPATLFGSAIHKALEIFYAGSFDERRLASLETLELMSYGHKVEGEEMDLVLRSIRGFVEKAALLKELPETDKRSIQNGVYILWNYFKTYLTDPYIAYSDENGPLIERDFTFVLWEDDKMQIEYFGRIDIVMKHLQTNELLVCDHKTSSVVGSDFYNRLKPNHQYTGYLLGAKKALGVQTDSFLVNCLQVKERPKTTRGSAPHFPRQITVRDESDYEEFTEAVRYAVQNYLECEKTGIWPIGHVNACAQYGGCSYLQACSAPKKMRENILKAKFNRGENNVTQ